MMMAFAIGLQWLLQLVNQLVGVEMLMVNSVCLRLAQGALAM